MLECVITISLRGAPVSYQWYNIWASAVAAVWVCGAQLKDGTTNIEGECTNSSAMPINLLMWCSGRLNNRDIRGKP